MQQCPLAVQGSSPFCPALLMRRPATPRLLLLLVPPLVLAISLVSCWTRVAHAPALQHWQLAAWSQRPQHQQVGAGAEAWAASAPGPAARTAQGARGPLPSHTGHQQAEQPVERSQPEGSQPEWGLQPSGTTSLPEVRVSIVTDHWLAGWEEERGQFQGDSKEYPLVCAAPGQPLRCRFGSPEVVDPLTADALLFHLPHISPVDYEFPPRFFRGQAFCGMSMESSLNFPQVDDPALLANFDCLFTYRLDSDVPVLYPIFDIRTFNEAASPGFEDRAPALFYMHSNCNASNGRHELVTALAARYGIPLVAPGACLHNTDTLPSRNQSEELRSAEKVAWMRHYRVCVAMENGNQEDYVTEKVWEALAAGCVPVYLGAPNARAHFLPANDSAIFVEDFASLGQLAAEIRRVLTNRAAFDSYLAWRPRPLEQLSPGYRALLGGDYFTQPHGFPRCQVCRLLAERRQRRQWVGASSRGSAVGQAGTLQRR